MLVQVKHRGGVLYVFITKIKGDFAKIKGYGGRIKCKNDIHNCFYGRHRYPEVRELQYTLQCTSCNQNLLLTSNYHKTRLTTCKIPCQFHTTLGNSESFTLD